MTNLSDDNNGVGYLRTECTWDGQDWFTYTAGSDVAISTQANVQTNHSLGCRNIDLLSNIGLPSYLNFTLDAVNPNITLTPTGITTVAPTTLLQVSAMDAAGIASSQLRLTWSNDGQEWNTTSTLFGSSWNTTLRNIVSNLTDGTVSIELVVTDRVGNQQTMTGISWQLNTTQPLVDIHLNGNHVNGYIGAGNISFTVSPTGVGSVVHYNLESNPNWSFLNGTTNTTVMLPVNNLTEGRVWLNTTITDAFSRVQHQTFVLKLINPLGQRQCLCFKGPIKGRTGVLFLVKMEATGFKRPPMMLGESATNTFPVHGMEGPGLSVRISICWHLR